jgi:hypothetical protein
VNISDWLPKRNHLGAQRSQKVHKPVRLAICFRQCIRIPQRRASGICRVEPGIGLRYEHYGNRTALLCIRKSLL